MKSIIKHLSIILCGILMIGCGYTSAHVRSIGARSRSGSAERFKADNIVNVNIVESDYKPEMNRGGFYSSSMRNDGTPTGSVEIDFNNVTWTDIKKDWRKGQINLHYDSEYRLFEVILTRKDSDMSTVTIKNRYRTWYGTPLQGLLLVSIPIDVATATIVLGGLIVTSPIWITAGAISIGN